jgi:hypothetical protein
MPASRAAAHLARKRSRVESVWRRAKGPRSPARRQKRSPMRDSPWHERRTPLAQPIQIAETGYYSRFPIECLDTDLHCVVQFRVLIDPVLQRSDRHIECISKFGLNSTAQTHELGKLRRIVSIVFGRLTWMLVFTSSSCCTSVPVGDQDHGGIALRRLQHAEAGD